MGGLRTLIGSVVLDKLIHTRSSSSLGKNRNYTIMLAFAGVFVLVACIFGLIALYYSMAARYAPDTAALITSGTSLVIALVIVLAAHTVREYHRPKAEHHFHELKTQFETALKNLEGDWETPIRENPKIAVALSALAGYILADRIT